MREFVGISASLEGWCFSLWRTRAKPREPHLSNRSLGEAGLRDELADDALDDRILTDLVITRSPMCRNRTATHMTRVSRLGFEQELLDTAFTCANHTVFSDPPASLGASEKTTVPSAVAHVPFREGQPNYSR